jgi:hypothetical protein
MKNATIKKSSFFSEGGGNFNTGLGSESLRENESCSKNTADGYQVLRQSTETSDNTAIGFNTLYNNTNKSMNRRKSVLKH